MLDHTFRIYDLVRGTMGQSVVTDFTAYLGCLREHLGVELDQAEQASLAAHFAALKPPEC